MGVNIQKQAQENFRKKTDTALKNVSDGDLFDKIIKSCPRRFLAKPYNGAQINEGEQIDLELSGNSIVGTRGTEKVLQAETPPAEVVKYMKTKGCMIEAVVSKWKPFSATLEIEPC